MKQFFVLFLGFIFAVISCSSETPVDEDVINNAPDDIVVEDGNSLLWRIEGEGYKTSYMYGTMHMIEEEYYHFTTKMTDLATNSETIIMEVGGMPNPLETLELMKLDSGDIRAIFTDDEIKTIVEFFDKKLGVEPDAFFEQYGKMKPFFILQGISQKYFEGPTQSYDLDIMGIAGNNDIPLVGLETVEQQLGFFDAVPQEDMRTMIVEGIENFDKEKKSTKKMMKIYSEQKVDKLIPLMNKQSPEFMDHADIFLYNRNKAWVPQIKEQMKDKKCFVAVGAAHLFGDGGLIDLLKKEGLTLTAISTEPED